MYNVVATGRFKRDLKLAIKRRYDIPLIDAVVTILAEGKPLPEK